MAQPIEHRSIDDGVELLKEHGFDGLSDAVTILLNSAMLAERSELALKVPQTRDGEFYPQSLQKGLRSERAMLLAVSRS